MVLSLSHMKQYQTDVYQMLPASVHWPHSDPVPTNTLGHYLQRGELLDYAAKVRQPLDGLRWLTGWLMDSRYLTVAPGD